MKERPIRKLYYSISEVSEITSLKKYVLRYWETEFSELKPSKNRAGNRIYRISDIKTVFLIKKLLYVDKYTIEGARQQLKKMKTDVRYQMKLSLEFLEITDLVHELTRALEEIKAILETSSE